MNAILFNTFRFFLLFKILPSSKHSKLQRQQVDLPVTAATTALPATI